MKKSILFLSRKYLKYSGIIIISYFIFVIQMSSTVISRITPRARDINIRNLTTILYPNLTNETAVRDAMTSFNDDINLKVALYVHLCYHTDVQSAFLNHILKKFFICNNTEMTIDGMQISPTFHNYIYRNFNQILRETMWNINVRVFFNATDNQYDKYREDVQHEIQFRRVANFILKVSQNFIIYYLNNHVLPNLTNPEDIVKVKLEALSAYAGQVNHVLYYADIVNNGTVFREMSYEIIMDERYNRLNNITPRHGQCRRDIEYIKFENTIFANNPLFMDLISQEMYDDMYNEEMDIGNRERYEPRYDEDDEDEEEEEDEEEDD
jgi:hypothetical protein